MSAGRCALEGAGARAGTGGHARARAGTGGHAGARAGTGGHAGAGARAGTGGHSGVSALVGWAHDTRQNYSITCLLWRIVYLTSHYRFLDKCQRKTDFITG